MFEAYFVKAAFSTYTEEKKIRKAVKKLEKFFKKIDLDCVTYAVKLDQPNFDMAKTVMLDEMDKLELQFGPKS